MEILLIRKNITKSISLMNKINLINSNIRIFKIITSIKEGLEIINQTSIDAIIIDYEIFKEINIVEFSSLENSIKFMIIISDKLMITKQGKCIFSTEENVSENILKLTKQYLNNENDIKEFISEELKYLGYNLSYKGSKYLLECIYYIYKHYDKYDEDNYSEVYSVIAQKYNTSINTLKCNITRATSIMFIECEESKLKSYLGTCTLPKTGSRIVIYTILNKLNKMF